MKITLIITLQIFTMLIFVSNHFIGELLSWYPAVWFFGIKMSSLIVDITLYIPIALQVIILILLLKEVDKDALQV